MDEHLPPNASEESDPTSSRSKPFSTTKGNLKFADWYDRKIADAFDAHDDVEDGNFLLTTIQSNNDLDSDDSEGLALLQSSLETVNDFGYDNDREDFPPSSHGFLWDIWYYHWFGSEDDRGWIFLGLTLLDPSAYKFLRFFLVTCLCLLVVHAYAIALGDKRDTTYGLYEMVVYDGTSIVTDSMVFFAVGRLHKAPSVDQFDFVVPLLLAAILQSWGATHLQNLQHSITPYELKCEWTWQMYLLVFGVCLPILGGLVLGHLAVAKQRKELSRTLTEWTMTGFLFLWGPYQFVATRNLKSFFHLHHWYYAWFLGMHCNLHDKWWSRLSMSVLWGIYVNGVAIFGRDPVLTCAISLYRSQSQECPFVGDNTYGAYTLEDLGKDLGIGGVDTPSTDESDAATMVCASDVTRWLL